MPTPADALRTYAVVRIGPHLVAVPADHVVRALPRPASWLRMPRRNGAVEGVVACDGRLVPVVRVNAWIGDPDPDLGPGPGPGAGPVHRPDPRVLVLREPAPDGATIGLLVDAVTGLRRARPQDVQRLFHDDDPQELFQSAIAGADDRAGPVPLLETGRLMRLAGVWCEAARPDVAVPAAAAEGASGEPAPTERAPSGRARESWATFRIGDASIGVRACDVAELVPVPGIEPLLAAAATGTRGLCRWRGRMVPAVDLGPVLQAGPDGAAAGWLCVVRHGDLRLGLLVQEVEGLRRLDAPPPAAGDDGGAGAGARCAASIVLDTVLGTAGRTLRRLDTAALFARHPEAAVGASRDAARVAARREAADPASHGFMIFDAGGAFASPVDAVREVIGLPGHVRERLDRDLPATVEWRGAAVPVIGLGRRRGAADGPPTQLAIVVLEGRSTAVAIGGVRALLPSWRASRTRSASGTVDIVTTGDADARTSFRVLDLAEVVRADGKATRGAARH